MPSDHLRCSSGSTQSVSLQCQPPVGRIRIGPARVKPGDLAAIDSVRLDSPRPVPSLSPDRAPERADLTTDHEKGYHGRGPRRAFLACGAGVGFIVWAVGRSEFVVVVGGASFHWRRHRLKTRPQSEWLDQRRWLARRWKKLSIATWSISFPRAGTRVSITRPREISARPPDRTVWQRHYRRGQIELGTAWSFDSRGRTKVDWIVQ